MIQENAACDMQNQQVYNQENILKIPKKLDQKKLKRKSRIEQYSLPNNQKRKKKNQKVGKISRKKSKNISNLETKGKQNTKKKV